MASTENIMSPAETQTPATSHQTMASNIINSTVAAVLNVTSNIEREMDITTTHAQIGMFIDKIFTNIYRFSGTKSNKNAFCKLLDRSIS